MTLKERVRSILLELPSSVQLLAVGKGRTPEEVLEAVNAGVAAVGENYIKDARDARSVVGTRVEWHYIGRLRSHDVRASNLTLFDMIESVDTLELAEKIDDKCASLGRVMPILVEVNSGGY